MNKVSWTCPQCNHSTETVNNETPRPECKNCQTQFNWESIWHLSDDQHEYLTLLDQLSTHKYNKPTVDLLANTEEAIQFLQDCFADSVEPNIALAELVKLSESQKPPKRELLDLTLFDMKTIAGRMTGKQGTAHNVMTDGAQKHFEEFNLDCIEAARAANLIGCGRGTYQMLLKIRKEIGDDRMKELTVKTPAYELFYEATRSHHVDLVNFAGFVSMMASRHNEIEDLKKNKS
jgi:transcription elongation factor Elf1